MYKVLFSNLWFSNVTQNINKQLIEIQMKIRENQKHIYILYTYHVS